MQVNRTTYTKKGQFSRTRTYGDPTSNDFEIVKAGTATGMEFTATYMGDRLTVTLSSEETEKIIRRLLRER